MLWTEMTDDLSEAVNGGSGCYEKHYCYYEKPKKEKCEYYEEPSSWYEEPSYCYEDKQYDKCDYYKSW